MKIEKQVVSLELSKRLKKLGVKQESLFIWTGDKEKDLCLMCTDSYDYTDYPGGGKIQISAFTVAELGKMLPARIVNPATRNMDRLCFYLKEHKGNDSYQDVRDGFTVEYWTNFYQPLVRITADTEATARAKMLIYLLENKLI